MDFLKGIKGRGKSRGEVKSIRSVTKNFGSVFFSVTDAKQTEACRAIFYGRTTLPHIITHEPREFVFFYRDGRAEVDNFPKSKVCR